MISCKKSFIATCFFLALPLVSWSEAPVVDDSDNFAMMEDLQAAESSAGRSKYDDVESRDMQSARDHSNDYAMNDTQEDGPALVKDDNSSSSNASAGSDFKSNAKLIEKVQSLQQEIQELRGQLEVQAHDLKLLQQQQIAFYKDLDTRLGSPANRTAVIKPSTDINLDAKTTAPKVTKAAPKSKPQAINTAQAVEPVKPVNPVSRANPADEQIGYLAAFELVKDKQYDAAIVAMQNFAQKYPQGGYTANAQYWLGELYMVKKDYAKAIEHFEIVLHQFPSSSKSAASMLKCGYAYYASGNQEEAVNRLEQVVKTYPDTPTAQMAKTKLESIKAV